MTMGKCYLQMWWFTIFPCTCSLLIDYNLSLRLSTATTYLAKLCKRIFLPIINIAPPVEQNQAIIPCWVCECHPCPWPYTTSPNFCFCLFIPHTSFTWCECGRVSTLSKYEIWKFNPEILKINNKNNSKNN